jgi:NAD(P)-dependent dehydrogenase (short-subunit alcohol dehydrogenase family)
MKVLLVGAHGTIGRAVAAELSERHDIISAGRSSGEHRVDFSDIRSIEDLFMKVGAVDAVASAAGNVALAPLESMTPEQFDVGLRDKLMGQVNLVIVGRKFVNPGGSFTLISGTLDEDPIRYGASASMVSGALNAFVRAAAIEFPAIRINAVSPTVLEESMGTHGPYFRGTEAVPARRVALAYSKSIEGVQSGQVYRVI